METYGALDVCAVLGAERRLDIATDFLQRLSDRFDVRVAQVRILSYFCDRDAASHPNSEMGRASGETMGRFAPNSGPVMAGERATLRLTPSLGHSDFFTADSTLYPYNEATT